MRRRVGMILAWVAATAVSIMIATAAVGAVRGRVTDTPPASAAATTTTATAAAGSGSTTTTTTAPSAGTTSSTTTTTRPPATTSTTSQAGSTTSTTGAPATTTTQPASQLQTLTAVGGSVTIEVTPTEIRLLGATPNPAFTVDDSELSPTKIEIEFTSATHQSRVRAELKDGVLDTEIDEEGGED